MIEKGRKPFHLKEKILYQTKINLWNEEELYLRSKLSKKKWDFLRPRKNNKSGDQGEILSLFKFSPFSYSYNKRFVKANFKNNLYFRKLVRLQYARLKDKNLKRVFQKTKSYKHFIDRIGSRLDVCLHNILYPLDRITVFSIHQSILHGLFSLNGRKVKSPNIQLKPFDVISFKISNLPIITNEMVYMKEESLDSVVMDIFQYYSDVANLNKEERDLFFEELALSLTTYYMYKPIPRFIADMNTFLNLVFDSFSKDNESNFSKKSKMKKMKNSLFCNSDDLVKCFKREDLEFVIDYQIDVFKNFFELGLGVVPDTDANNTDYGFFNGNFRSESFEVMVNEDFVDVVYLGPSEEDYKINTNDKYLLHYLYR